ncbi:MAG TPA: cadherin-like domain-containing protein, partial [Myxococcota bacterium]|nr:cadherin-like domain-containing protein [Myxococcota bacterium]
MAFATLAQPTLQNPAFDTAGDPHRAPAWSTTGDITFAPGAATLQETATTQTRLDQVFVLGEDDRFLSFTLSGLARHAAADGPGDAFEVALLDAGTGLSLLGPTGLTHSDAFLNLQTDGREYQAGGVTTVQDPDGRRTYRVDLAGVHAPAGTVVHLSFDLIGFGRGAAATDSRVTIEALHLTGDSNPLVADDLAVTAEDTPLSIDVLANDRAGDGSPLTLRSADGATHGTLALADGRLRYTPDADWSGSESLRYVVADAAGRTAEGRVKLTVTPVNDAPTLATPAALEVAEGDTLRLFVVGDDGDGDPLTYALDAAPTGAAIDPASGLLTWTAADGEAWEVFTVRVTDGAGAWATQTFSIHVADVPPTLTVSGREAVYRDDRFTLDLTSRDPGADTLTAWRFDWGDGEVAELPGDRRGVDHTYRRLGPMTIRAWAIDDDGAYALDPLTVVVLPPPLQVTSRHPDANGVAVRFNDRFDSSVIALYGTSEAADVQLSDAQGTLVPGTLFVDPDGQGLRYVLSGRGWSAGTYHLTLYSGPQAFHSVWSALDGNADGLAGDAYGSDFTVAPPPPIRLSWPDFMRGPGQAVEVPGPSSSSLLPLTLTSAGGVRRLEFGVRYDPALLSIADVVAGAGLPGAANWRPSRAPR